MKRIDDLMNKLKMTCRKHKTQKKNINNLNYKLQKRLN